MGGAPLLPIDYVVLAILGVALMRGLLRGLLRETFSIAALGAAVVVVRLFYGDVAEWLRHRTANPFTRVRFPASPLMPYRHVPRSACCSWGAASRCWWPMSWRSVERRIVHRAHASNRAGPCEIGTVRRSR